MAKIRITEEKLTSLIEESIYELLQEGEHDEALGHWLGNKFQTLRNKWNNFKGDFKAGMNNARYNNRNYDSYSQYGDDANGMRNFDGGNYARYRYQTAVDRNGNADQSWTTPNGTRVNNRFNNDQGNQQSQTQPQPQTHPQTQQQAQHQQQSQAQQQQNVSQTNNRTTQINPQERMRELANYLRQKGHTLINGRWAYTQDNSNWPASKSRYDDIRKAALEYYRLQGDQNGAGLSENKKYLQKVVNESVNKTLKKYFKK